MVARVSFTLSEFDKLPRRPRRDTALAVCQGCAATLLAKTAPPVNGRVDAQQDTLVHGAFQEVSLPCEGT